MTKRKLTKECTVKLKVVMTNFYFDFLNTDFIESDNSCFESIYTSDSDSDILPVKRCVMQLEIFSNSEVEENNENENSDINDFTVWKDIMHLF